MTPEGVAGAVLRWVRFYTRGLPAAVAQRRVDEIAADLHEHLAQERAEGISDRRIALSVLSRMVRGVPADAAWQRAARPEKGSLMRLLVAVLVPAILAAAVGIAAIVYGEGDDSPGLQLLGALLVVGAATFGVRAVRSR